MAEARRVVTNPADPTQHYILWSNGYLQPIGGALPVTQDEGSVNSPSGNAPTFYTWGNPDIAVAVQIIDWTTPKGYTLTQYGHVWPWGGATVTPGATAVPRTGAPEYLFGLDGGTQYPAYGFVIDFYMNPAGDGLGYYLTYKGDVVGFGTGITAITHSAFLTDAGARMLQMDWSSKRYWVLDDWGRVWSFNGASSVAVVDKNSVSATAPAYIWGRGGKASFRMYDKSAAGKGWMEDGFGRMYAIGGAEQPRGYLSGTVANSARDMDVIDDGTSTNPLRLTQLGAQGALTEFVSSTAPTVAVLDPATGSTITDTSRPYVAWNYYDAEGDGQDYYKVRVFSAAQYGAGGFSASTSAATWETDGTDLNTRRVQIGTDLANATYRAYVYTEDTSGLNSGWTVYSQFTISLTPLSQPTVTPTVNGGLSGTSLAVHAATGAGLPGSALFLVQFSDDGTNWYTVRGSEALVPDGSGNATGVDYEAPFGVQRSYRAYTYTYDADTDVWQASVVSSTANATLTPQNVWTLTLPGDTTNDMTVKPTDNFSPAREIISSTYKPIGREDPIVITDGVPKYPSFDMSLWILDASDRADIEALLGSDSVLLLRTPFGENYYFKPVDNWTKDLMHATPTSGETTSIRDANKFRFKCQSVKRPVAGMSSGPMKES